MDLYTGNLRLHRTCAGFTLKVQAFGNFSSGLAAGGNLATYRDPLNREDWVMVAGSMRDLIAHPAASSPLAKTQHWDLYSALGSVVRAIDENPRAGHKYDPPKGYSRSAKRQLLLNCLQVARETRDARFVDEYYDYVVAALRPLDRKAYPDDLPLVEPFLASRQSGAGSAAGR